MSCWSRWWLRGIDGGEGGISRVGGCVECVSG